MNVVGLITEYNPFHNGHLHHINLAKEVTNADYVVVVMSGNFLQRGTPAIIDKYKRTYMALKCGADVVVELPCAFATASAETFAYGAVSILNKMGCVNTICFGSECGDITILEEVANLLVNEPSSFKNALKKHLKKGVTFPIARKNALLDSIKTSHYSKSELEQILSEPNNILAIEYVKALKKFKSPIQPITIKRIVSGYHDTQINDTICSASAIRVAIQSNGLHDFKNQVPSCVYEILQQEYEKTFPIFMNDFSSLLKYKLLLSQEKPLTTYLDVSDSLANTIINHLDQYQNAESFINLLKSKQYTLTRINRSLTHILLNIEQDLSREYAEKDFAQYIRLLGFKKESTNLLTMIKEKATIPIISKLANYKSLLNPLGISMIEQDIFASDLYNTIVIDKFDCNIPNEFRQQIIML